MILRQLLIDDHGGVLVLVPDGLVTQWRDELTSKFRMGAARLLGRSDVV
jgi:hypothetical protein